MVANNKSVKRLNKSAVLNLVRVKKAISKADIAAQTGLSANAAGQIAGELVLEKYLYISGIGASKGGRRPRLLSLRPNFYYTLGIDIDTDRIRIVRADLTGQILSSKRIEIGGDNSPENVFEKVNSQIKKNAGVNLLGVGFAVAGQVDTKTNTIAFAPNLGWKNIKLSDYIFAPVKIQAENEAAASAIYEKWYGMCREVDNFVCINAKSGIGAGIFLGGKSYKPISPGAGEIGHVTVDINGPKCECGSNGCLEVFAAPARIARNLGLSSIDEVISRIKSGDMKALAALKGSAPYLGAAIAGLINLLTPEKIVLGREFTKYAQFIIDDVKEIANEKILPPLSGFSKINISKDGKMSSVIGAATLPLMDLFCGAGDE